MENNVMRELRIVMGTWYIEFCVDSPATALEIFLLPLELALDFPEEEGMMQQSSVSISLSF